jgi:hypothetical protein
MLGREILGRDVADVFEEIPTFLEGFGPALLAIALAVGVPLTIERARRPILEVELEEPVEDDRWSIAHVLVRNLPMAERGRGARWLGRWLTAFAADGCSLQIVIYALPGSVYDAIGFDGKWTSRPEPVSTDFVWTGSQLQRIDRYDQQKLAGIHEITLQPGRGESVAIAIRERGSTNAFAYWAERIYADAGGRPFPEHPDCELPPGNYQVEIEARAGEVRSGWRGFGLVVDAETDAIFLMEEAEDE